MTLTRRGFTLGSAGALGVAAGGLARPAIAASEPIRVGWLAAMTGPSSTPAIGFDRGVRYQVDADQRRRRREGADDRAGHPRHPGRSHQGGECHAGDDQPAEGARHLGADQLRRVARHHADHGPLQDAQHPSLRGGQPDRSGEIPERIPHGAVQRAMGRRGAQLLPEHRQGDEGRGGRRHHRLRHVGRRRLGRRRSRRTGRTSSIRRRSTPPSRT